METKEKKPQFSSTPKFKGKRRFVQSVFDMSVRKSVAVMNDKEITT